MKVLKIAATIRMILVVDQDAPGPAWLKKELETIQGVATTQVDGYATEDILAISLGPQNRKQEG